MHWKYVWNETPEINERVLIWDEEDEIVYLGEYIGPKIINEQQNECSGIIQRIVHQFRVKLLYLNEESFISFEYWSHLPRGPKKLT